MCRTTPKSQQGPANPWSILVAQEARSVGFPNDLSPPATEQGRLDKPALSHLGDYIPHTHDPQSERRVGVLLTLFLATKVHVWCHPDLGRLRVASQQDRAMMILIL